jgi:hypothetical protein
MTGQEEDHPIPDPRTDPAALRRHLTFLASVIACTEDQVADTLEHLALTRPRDAKRLLARAAHAREYAELERTRAAMFSQPQPQPAPARPESRSGS